MSGFKTSIRKALQGPLNTAIIASDMPTIDGKPAIQWPGLPLDRTQLTELVRFNNHVGTPIVLELGLHPLMQYSGFAKIGVFTKAGQSQDRNDTIAGIVEAAYPYGTMLTFDAVTVIVDKVDHGDFVPSDGSWDYSPVDINWTVYRRV